MKFRVICDDDYETYEYYLEEMDKFLELDKKDILIRFITDTGNKTTFYYDEIVKEDVVCLVRSKSYQIIQTMSPAS